MNNTHHYESSEVTFFYGKNSLTLLCATNPFRIAQDSIPSALHICEIRGVDDTDDSIDNLEQRAKDCGLDTNEVYLRLKAIAEETEETWELVEWLEEHDCMCSDFYTTAREGIMVDFFESVVMERSLEDIRDELGAPHGYELDCAITDAYQQRGVNRAYQMAIGNA